MSAGLLRRPSVDDVVPISGLPLPDRIEALCQAMQKRCNLDRPVETRMLPNWVDFLDLTHLNRSELGSLLNLLDTKLEGDAFFAWRLLRHIANRHSAMAKSSSPIVKDFRASATDLCVTVVSKHWHVLISHEKDWIEQCLVRIAPDIFLKIVENDKLEMNRYTSLAIYRALCVYTEAHVPGAPSDRKGTPAADLTEDHLKRITAALGKFCSRHSLMHCQSCQSNDSQQRRGSLYARRPSFPCSLDDLTTLCNDTSNMCTLRSSSTSEIPDHSPSLHSMAAPLRCPPPIMEASFEGSGHNGKFTEL